MGQLPAAIHGHLMPNPIAYSLSVKKKNALWSGLNIMGHLTAESSGERPNMLNPVEESPLLRFEETPKKVGEAKTTSSRSGLINLSLQSCAIC